MKIMTREEAVELELEFVKADASILGSRVTKAEMRGLAECNVNRYVAFGMLELKDDPIAMALNILENPPSVEDRFTRAFIAILPSERVYIKSVLKAIDDAGLMLVEK